MDRMKFLSTENVCYFQLSKKIGIQCFFKVVASRPFFFGHFPYPIGIEKGIGRKDKYSQTHPQRLRLSFPHLQHFYRQCSPKALQAHPNRYSSSK